MLKLSDLTKLIKSFARNSAISDEEFLNAFLFPFVIAGNIKNKNDKDFPPKQKLKLPGQL